MRPYYEDDLITLYCGDCMAITDWLEADVLVTDPPYGMAYRSGSARAVSKSRITRTTAYREAAAIVGDEDATLRDAVLEAWGPERAALVFGTWRVPRPADVRQLIVWDKGESPGMGDLRIPWGPSHEDVYALGTKGWARKRGASVIRTPTLSPTNPQRPNHPTPKPIPLMERLIASTAGVIADPFAGSGSTLVAARNLGRRVIGVEIDERHCQTIVDRLAQQAFVFDLDAEPAPDLHLDLIGDPR